MYPFFFVCVLLFCLLFFLFFSHSTIEVQRMKKWIILIQVFLSKLFVNGRAIWEWKDHFGGSTLTLITRLFTLLPHSIISWLFCSSAMRCYSFKMSKKIVWKKINISVCLSFFFQALTSSLRALANWFSKNARMCVRVCVCGCVCVDVTKCITYQLLFL